jgi:hypothetical protein
VDDPVCGVSVRRVVLATAARCAIRLSATGAAAV